MTIRDLERLEQEVAAQQPSRLVDVRIIEQLAELKRLSATAASAEEARAVTSRVAQLSRAYRIKKGIGLPGTPIDQALMIDNEYVRRPHLDYLSKRVALAVQDVERGHNRFMTISMPPRVGKSRLISFHTPLWLLRRHPEWKVVLSSYDGTLTTQWARDIRFMIEDNPELGIAIRRDGGAGSHWETVERGGMLATEVRGGNFTGRGAKVLVIDDPVKDFAEAQSPRIREAMWNWWLSVAATRLEAPYLVLVVMTRWHEDDFVGRLLNSEYEGDPHRWEVIKLPALATDEKDALGRAEGDPLFSPLVEETRLEAIERWEETRRMVGSYHFGGMYQQNPVPAKGAIFDSAWWRFWTIFPHQATADGRIVYLDPNALVSGRWLDSWDFAFKGVDTSDYVVGQRWVRSGANRYLTAQKRGRWPFTRCLKEMREWAGVSAPDEQPLQPSQNPYGHLVHQRLVEAKANGEAIMDVLHDQVPGMKPVSPRESKEARARSVTPECESGNVYLPFPSDPGNEWVMELLSELRNFPFDSNDDQVDALTQALNELRDPGIGHVTVPGQLPTRIGVGSDRTAGRTLAQTARTLPPRDYGRTRRIPGR